MAAAANRQFRRLFRTMSRTRAGSGRF